MQFGEFLFFSKGIDIGNPDQILAQVEQEQRDEEGGVAPENGEGQDDEEDEVNEEVEFEKGLKLKFHTCPVSCRVVPGQAWSQVLDSASP